MNTDPASLYYLAKEALEFAPVWALRARLNALQALADAMQDWSPDEVDYLGCILTPYTDAVVHELAKKEQGDAYVPYPHPVGEGPSDRSESEL